MRKEIDDIRDIKKTHKKQNKPKNENKQKTKRKRSRERRGSPLWSSRSNDKVRKY